MATRDVVLHNLLTSGVRIAPRAPYTIDGGSFLVNLGDVSWSNLPAEETVAGGDEATVAVDLSEVAECKLTLHVTGGFSGVLVKAVAITDLVNFSTWADVSAEVAVPTSNTVVQTAWTAIPAPQQTLVLLAAIASGGNGAVTPAMNFSVMFR